MSSSQFVQVVVLFCLSAVFMSYLVSFIRQVLDLSLFVAYVIWVVLSAFMSLCFAALVLFD